MTFDNELELMVVSIKVNVQQVSKMANKKRKCNAKTLAQFCMSEKKRKKKSIKQSNHCK